MPSTTLPKTTARQQTDQQKDKLGTEVIALSNQVYRWLCLVYQRSKLALACGHQALCVLDEKQAQTAEQG